MSDLSTTLMYVTGESFVLHYDNIIMETADSRYDMAPRLFTLFVKLMLGGCFNYS